MKQTKISVIGLGPVGLVTAACLAHRSFPVVGLDIDKSRIEALSRAHVPFYENELDSLVSETTRSGAFTLTTDFDKAVLETEISFVCVGTPPLDNGVASLKPLEASLNSLGRSLRKKQGYHLVSIKSTVPPGTTDNLAREALENSSGLKVEKEFGLCCNPEFLREGSAVHDTMHPDRVVIGSHDKKSGELMEKMWREFYPEPKPPILRTTAVNAEITKYASNSFLAMKISFINLIANLCQRIPKADVQDVAKGMGLDSRINPQFLRAGLGFGGSCFAKDLRTFIHSYEKFGVEPTLLEDIVELNEEQPLKAIELAKSHLGEIRGKRFAILGLAFKPGTDDIRDAVSLKIIRAIVKDGGQVVAYDPKASGNVKRIFQNNVEYASSPKQCMAGSDCCIIVTEWDEFKELQPEDFMKHMKTPVLIDGRRIHDWRKFQGKSKFSAIGLGDIEIENSG